MPEMTPHTGLKKPLESETADISVINENMDKIDSALGDLAGVPTTAKDAAGAITELHEAIQEIDVDIQDGSITPEKLSFDPTTQTELDAHVNAASVHGATTAPTANRLMIRDANGRSKVAMPTESSDIARLDTVNNKFGALSTTGILDWNDATNTQPGTGPTLLLGSATNGPGGATFYHVLNFEYGTKNGLGQITQFAIPYAQTPSLNEGLKYRARYSGEWMPWHRLWGDGQLRINAGKLEYFDGTGWRSVNGGVPNWLAEFDILNDGADGAFTPSSSRTLSSGLYRFSSLNIPAGVTVTPSGTYLVILVNGVANIEGTLSASGKGSAGGTYDFIAKSGGVAGGAGGGGGYHPSYNTGSAGAPGNVEGNIAGGVRGSPGGAGSSTNAAWIDFYDAFNNYPLFAGGGGGRGGGSLNANYPNGGAGGGVIIVVAKSITGLGAIRADGLAGANGVGASSGAGGGGGGLAVAVAHSMSGLVVTANGGAGGLPDGSGTVAGGAGGNGFALKIVR